MSGLDSARYAAWRPCSSALPLMPRLTLAANCASGEGWLRGVTMRSAGVPVRGTKRPASPLDSTSVVVTAIW